jgi:hypothetical protein
LGSTPQRVDSLLDGVIVHGDRTSPLTYLPNTRGSGEANMSSRTSWAKHSSLVDLQLASHGSALRPRQEEARQSRAAGDPAGEPVIAAGFGTVVERSILTASVGS